MRKLLTAAVLIAQAFAAASTAETSAPSWLIVQKAGEVSVSTGGFFPVALKADVALPEGAVVTTGPTGRAILRRGAEQIALDPKSRIVLAAGSSNSTYVRQEAGSAFFNIGKRRAPHFEVGTPFLAAIVKGTSFRVNVNGAGAAVHVTEGAVEVATVFRSAVTLVKPGAGALVRASGKGQIQLVADGRPTRVVTTNEGGWDAPPASSDANTDLSSDVSGGGDVAADLSGATAGASDVVASLPTGGSLLRTSVSFSGTTEKASRPHQFNATRQSSPALPNTDGAKAALASHIDYTAVAKTAGNPTPTAYRPSRARRDKSNADLPMREIGFSLLGLFLFMFASQFLKLRRARVHARR